MCIRDREACDVVLNATAGNDHSADAPLGIREGHLQVDQAIETDDHAEAGPDSWMRRRAEIQKFEQPARRNSGPQTDHDVVGACERKDDPVDLRAAHAHHYTRAPKISVLSQRPPLLGEEGRSRTQHGYFWRARIVVRVSRPQIYRIIFTLAGAYNIMIGLWAAIAPRGLFELLDLGPPSHPGIWACLGMVIGLYGLIYLQVAFTDPKRRVSAVIVAGRSIEYDVTRFLIGMGLAGKILGPIGFILAVRNGELPLRLIPLIALDDLVWWVPFTLYLIDGTAIATALARHAPRLCSVVHVVAAGATLAWISGGSEAEPNPAARAAYIAAHVQAWRAAWFIWMIAAISLGGFFCWWAAGSLKPRLARIALVIGCIGILVDFFADALFIGWIPDGYSSYAQFTTIVS